MRAQVCKVSRTRPPSLAIGPSGSKCEQIHQGLAGTPATETDRPHKNINVHDTSPKKRQQLCSHTDSYRHTDMQIVTDSYRYTYIQVVTDVQILTDSYR